MSFPDLIVELLAAIDCADAAQALELCSQAVAMSAQKPTGFDREFALLIDVADMLRRTTQPALAKGA